MKLHKRTGGALLGIGVMLVMGCSAKQPSGSHAGGHGDMGRGPAAPTTYVTRPLTAALGSDPASNLLSAGLGTSVDARLLVVTAQGNDPGYLAIVQSLRYLGTPYEVFNAATQPELTADRLATGNHGRYNGILLDIGNLSNGSASAFSDAEWTVLANYESMFQVRRASVYTFPEAAYGLSINGDGFDTTATPLSVNCTALGIQVFPDVNCAAPIDVRHAWAYPAAVTDASTRPLFTDGSGNVFGAIRDHGGGRESLVLTFGQSPTLVHSLGLLYDVVRWVTRGIHLGERHIYAGAQIDDLFLSTELYGSEEPFRMSDSDLEALHEWQRTKRAQPVTAGLRMAWAINGVGSTAEDPLTVRAQAIGTGFEWLNHTWDHAYLNPTIPPDVTEDEWAGTYALALPEFTQNIDLIQSLGLTSFNLVNAITPSVSGLDNPEAMRAMYDAGIRYIVSDTSQPGYDNPSPNAGIYNSFQPDILMIPRRPTNLFYHVSTPSEWEAAYNFTYNSFWNRDLTYSEIVDLEADMLLQYLLRGENDPWMFHQANVRDFESGHSLLSDLHDRLFEKYAAVSRLPIISPTMEQLGAQVASRMQYDASGAIAVIGPGNQITLSVGRAATVPVTGLCTPSAETYGGQKISHVSLPAGGQVTFSLDGCNEGSAGGTAGAGGAPGTGGAPGMGGAAGSGGAPGTGGATVTGGSSGSGDVGSGAAGGAVGSGGAPMAGGSPGTSTGGTSAVTVESGGVSGGGTVVGSGGASGTGGTIGSGAGEVVTGGGAGSGSAFATGGVVGAGSSGGSGGSGGAVSSSGSGGSGGAVSSIGSGGSSGAVSSGGSGGALVEANPPTDGSAGVLGSGGPVGSSGPSEPGSGSGTGGAVGIGGSMNSGAPSGAAGAPCTGGAAGPGGPVGSDGGPSVNNLDGR